MIRSNLIANSQIVLNIRVFFIKYSSIKYSSIYFNMKMSNVLKNTINFFFSIWTYGPNILRTMTLFTFHGKHRLVTNSIRSCFASIAKFITVFIFFIHELNTGKSSPNLTRNHCLFKYLQSDCGQYAVDRKHGIYCRCKYIPNKLGIGKLQVSV